MNAGEKDKLETITDLFKEMLDVIEFEKEIIRKSFAFNAIRENTIFHISEIINNYSREFKAKHRQINWQEFKQIRNFLAHTYSPKGYVKAAWVAEILIPETIEHLKNIEADERSKSSPFNRVSALRGPLVKFFGTEKRSKKKRLGEVMDISGELKSICSKYGASNIAIFGSVARGDENPKSDVDFLVDMDLRTSLGLRDLYAQQEALKNELSRTLKCKTDVCLRTDLRPTVLKAALRDEVLI
jgi:predicted nucleotidyltransferase/uncharacterized protein with HEPN domain